jgi:hypothetical protein
MEDVGSLRLFNVAGAKARHGLHVIGSAGELATGWKEERVVEQQVIGKHGMGHGDDEG